MRSLVRYLLLLWIWLLIPLPMLLNNIGCGKGTAFIIIFLYPISPAGFTVFLHSAGRIFLLAKVPKEEEPVWERRMVFLYSAVVMMFVIVALVNGLWLVVWLTMIPFYSLYCV